MEASQSQSTLRPSLWTSDGRIGGDATAQHDKQRRGRRAGMEADHSTLLSGRTSGIVRCVGSRSAQPSPLARVQRVSLRASGGSAQTQCARE